MINHFNSRYPAVLFTIIWLLIITGCAEIGAPPGGPIDRTGPYIVSAEPANGSLNVPISDRVTIFFSERIVKPNRGQSVHVSPRFRDELRLDWGSDNLTVLFPDSFKTNQTYVLTISNQVTDLRNNPVDSNISVAFSTGSALDSGHVSGQIMDENRPVSGAQVALFDIRRVSDSVIYDSLYADYIVGGNREGFFSFQNIPDMEYRLVAFIDLNRDERLNPHDEKYAVADRKIVVGGEVQTEDLQLLLTDQDSTTLALEAAELTSDGLIRLRLNQPIDLSRLSNNPGSTRLIPLDTAINLLSAISISETDLTSASTINLYFGQIPDGDYDLSLDWSEEQDQLSLEQISLKNSVDTRRPEVVAFYPSESPSFARNLEFFLIFSEPIDTTLFTDQTLLLWNQDSSLVPISYEWQNPFKLNLLPGEIRDGESYRLELTEFEVSDFLGNRLGDSLMPFSFSIFDPDSLGEISGTLSVLLPHRQSDPAALSFVRAADNRVFDLMLSERSFSILVPPGKYLLSGFLDSDSDGERGAGSILPFSFAESASNYPDTIQVRARFETAGIEFEFR